MKATATETQYFICQVTSSGGLSKASWVGAEGGGGGGEGEGKSHNFTPKLWQQLTKQKDGTEIANQWQPTRNSQSESGKTRVLQLQWATVYQESLQTSAANEIKNESN